MLLWGSVPLCLCWPLSLLQSVCVTRFNYCYLHVIITYRSLSSKCPSRISAYGNAGCSINPPPPHPVQLVQCVVASGHVHVAGHLRRASVWQIPKGGSASTPYDMAMSWHDGWRMQITGGPAIFARGTATYQYNMFSLRTYELALTQ